MTMQQKMWLWHIWNHLVAIGGLCVIVLNGYWSYLIISLMMSFICLQVANISLHRYLSHKSFKTGPRRDIFLRWINIWTGLGPSIMWVITHRQHHADSDQLHDYQNPRVIGKLRSWFTVYPKTTFNIRFGKDIIQCTHSKFIYKHYFKMQFILYAIIFLINPWIVILVLAIPMTVVFHGAASIGVLTHMWGYRVLDTPDKSTNNWLASILSCGEGWHNYHHAKPGDYRQGYNWWELDPPAWIIERFFKNDA